MKQVITENNRHQHTTEHPNPNTSEDGDRPRSSLPAKKDKLCRCWQEDITLEAAKEAAGTDKGEYFYRDRVLYHWEEGHTVMTEQIVWQLCTLPTKYPRRSPLEAEDHAEVLLPDCLS